MRRTPLERKTPLRAVREGGGWTPPEPVPMNLEGAASALANRERSLVAALQPRTTVRAIPKTPPRVAPKETGEFKKIPRQHILDRDKDPAGEIRCVRCGAYAETCSVGYSVHHRINRGMGGTSDPLIGRPANGAVLCGDGVQGCHGWVTRNAEAARLRGYVVESSKDPATVPMYTMLHGWVLLDNKGFLTRVAPPPNGDAHQADTVRRRDTDGTGSASSAHG